MKKQQQKNPWPFRSGTVKPATQKRIDSVAGKPLASFNTANVYLTLSFRLKSLSAMVSFIFVVIGKFFLPQYFQKIHLLRRPIKHVDHELDTRIPFVPKKIHVYVSFINFYIRPLAMLLKRFGARNGAKLCTEFLKYIRLEYNEAYRMYSYCLTTTYRPRWKEGDDGKLITFIQGGDPHYMCVPSLHIAICCLVLYFYRMLFEREHFSDAEKTQWNTELRSQAIAISESVLYVKQHSVNCIPAAIYMVTKIAPELISVQDGVDFINALFATANDITPQNKAAIIEHIHFMYERLLLESTTENDWLPPLQRWLNSNTPHTYNPAIYTSAMPNV